MKNLIRKTIFLAAIVIAGLTVAQAQRVIKGTVYMDGEPAAGVTVEVHKGGTMTTSFDGKYEVEADPKSKWIKFTPLATGESVREDIETLQGDVLDIAVTGSLPSEGGEVEQTSGNVNLSSADELIKAGDDNFKNEYSLYNEFYKQDDYKSAMPHWKKLVAEYPKSTPNLYIQGAKMYESMIDNASNDAERNKLMGEYMKLYDTRVKYFGQEGYVLGRKGTAWYNYKLHKINGDMPEGDELNQIHKTGYEHLKKSVDTQGNESEPPVLVLLMQSTVALFKLGELPKETVVQNYERCAEIANEIISKNEDPKTVEVTRDQVLPYIEELFGKSGAADCDVLVKIYSSEFNEKSDDVEFIKTMLRRLGRANCTESELFSNATEKLYELEPSAEAAYNMARRYLKNNEMDKAKEYYQMAIDQETDNKLLATYYYQRGVLHLSEAQYQAAIQDAKKAVSLDPDLCDANMLIGNVYVTSSSKFPGKEIEKSAIFWLACDYFEKARRSEDCSIDAASNISKYRKYFPNKEEAFMENLKEGATYHVGGWINENTRVRF